MLAVVACHCVDAEVRVHALQELLSAEMIVQ
jgi:hypothetical protein